jgi:hypothetical protein
MQRMRLSRIVVRRANAPGTTLDPAPARCIGEGRRRDRSARAADIVWRSSRAPGRRAESEAQPASLRAATATSVPTAMPVSAPTSTSKG